MWIESLETERGGEGSEVGGGFFATKVGMCALKARVGEDMSL